MLKKIPNLVSHSTADSSSPSECSPFEAATCKFQKPLTCKNLVKRMNNEILKYNNHIYYLEERFDEAGNRLKPYIGVAHWITSTKDYDHSSFELHHVVPFTDWEKNTKNVRAKVKHNALILLPKKMHHHLEVPTLKMDKETFEKVYKIHPNEILFDVNSKISRTKVLFYTTDILNSGANSPINIYAPDFFADCEQRLKGWDKEAQTETLFNASNKAADYEFSEVN